MLVLFNFPSLSKISHNFHLISFCICHTQSGGNSGQIFSCTSICKFIYFFVSSVVELKWKKLRWILLSYHSCPLLLFIIQATPRIFVCVHLRGWRYRSLYFPGGLWKDCICKKVGMEAVWQWAMRGDEWCRISWPWAARDSTQRILFRFYEQHFW